MAELWNPPADMRGIDRDPDRHVSVKFEAELIGGHVHVKVRAANRHPSVQVDHSRGLCGELVFAPAEWLLLRAALQSVTPETVGPLWLYDGGGQKIAPAGGAYSQVPDQQFIEITGWPDRKEPT